MSQAASQAAAFRTEVADRGEAWTVEGDQGIPAPELGGGRRAMPFWSSRGRVERVIACVEAYRGFRVRRVPLEEFEERWLPGLQRDGLLVGVNWTGPRATGYDVEPGDVLGWLKAGRRRPE